MKYYGDVKAFIECSSAMQDVYKTIDKYNPGKRQKILILLDDITADKISNKKLNPIVSKPFIWGRKLDISVVFIINHVLKCQKIPD